MNITEASDVSKHTKQEKAKEVINRPGQDLEPVQILQRHRALLS